MAYFEIKTISIHLFINCASYRWKINFDFFRSPFIDSVLVVVSSVMCVLEAIKTSEFEFGSAVPDCQSIWYQESETTISIFSYFAWL